VLSGGKALTDNELPITGYLDRFSHRPGEAFSAHVSVRDGGGYRARLLRLLSGDPNPVGPGLRFADLSSHLDRQIVGRRQAIRVGSYGIVDAAPMRPARAAFTWTVLCCASLPAQTASVFAEEGGGAHVVLGIGPDGASADLKWPGGILQLQSGRRLQQDRWYRLWLSIDIATGRVVLGQRPLDRPEGVRATASVQGLTLPLNSKLLFAARDAATPRANFNGKLEAPAILAGFFETWAEDGLSLPVHADPVAAWDFAQGIDSVSLVDTGPQRAHGRVINLPMRAVVGARWSGRHMRWLNAPHEYAAIRFHEDDLEDCGWEPDFEWEVPTDLPSGAYAFHISCAAGEDWLPFFILPSREGPFSPIAVLASTFTYQAYGNQGRGNADEQYRRTIAEWGAYPHHPDWYPIYGRSTYDRHRDGSGVAYASRRRPLLNMRPGFLTFGDGTSSGLRDYSADTHLWAWLADKGFAFDIITDEDLDEQGPPLIAPYRAVLTGSHPEYYTDRMLDALQGFVDNGGRLAYLGGNGFYWRIAHVPALPHVMEVRRAEGGIRAWASEPGEYYHALDGEYGGLWRRNRRPPQKLVGVGFSSQGKFEATHYRRTEASKHPDLAWIFDRVEGDVIGEYGLCAGGAAGYELDRADKSLGTPENAVVLATSENPPASASHVHEDMLGVSVTVTGVPVATLIRADMVYFETPSGGAVFSVGSMTFLGSLWRNGFEGPVSRLLQNVVRRFCEPRCSEADLGETIRHR
jgi:N,N-dimethylformamidase